MTAELVLEGLRRFTILGDFLLSNMEPARRLLDAQSLILNEKYRDAIVSGMKEWCSAIQGVVAFTSSPCSIIVATELARALHLPILLVEPRRKFPVPDQIEEFALKGEVLQQGSAVLLVLDVSVTGRSALAACQTLREYGLNPTVGTVLDRQWGANERLADHGVTLRRLAEEKDLWPTERADAHRPLDSSQIEAQRSKLKQIYPWPLRLKDGGVQDHSNG